MSPLYTVNCIGYVPVQYVAIYQGYPDRTTIPAILAYILGSICPRCLNHSVSFVLSSLYGDVLSDLPPILEPWENYLLAIQATFSYGYSTFYFSPIAVLITSIVAFILNSRLPSGRRRFYVVLKLGQ